MFEYDANKALLCKQKLVWDPKPTDGFLRTIERNMISNWFEDHIPTLASRPESWILIKGILKTVEKEGGSLKAINKISPEILWKLLKRMVTIDL